MKIAVGSDERSHLTDFVVDWLKQKSHEVELYGPLAEEKLDWVEVAARVAQRVVSGACQEGILFCWTGTGVAMAANKVPGIRAALCADAPTAVGARKWDHANVLALSLRVTSEALAGEILEAWLATPFDSKETETVAKLARLEDKARQAKTS